MPIKIDFNFTDWNYLDKAIKASKQRLNKRTEKLIKEIAEDFKSNPPKTVKIKGLQFYDCEWSGREEAGSIILSAFIPGTEKSFTAKIPLDNLNWVEDEN